MTAGKRAFLGCALILALAACSRRLPAPAPVAEADPPAAAEAAAQPVELAGGPASDLQPAAFPEDLPPAPDQSAPPPAEAAPVLASLEARPRTRPRLDGPAPPLAGGPDERPPSDPLEPVNRRLYVVDRAMGKAMVQPVRILRREPPHAHAALKAARNVLDNLDEPSVAANDLLQRKVGRAFTSVVRFVINSTLGVAGIRDVASRMGFKRRDNNMDRTLAAYGAPAGPYLFLPIAGPTTLRAAVGAVGEGYLYPPHWLHVAEGIGAALRGAGYAKLAQKALNRADQSTPAGGGADGYVKTRRAYLQAQARPIEPAIEPPATTVAYITEVER